MLRFSTSFFRGISSQCRIAKKFPAEMKISLDHNSQGSSLKNYVVVVSWETETSSHTRYENDEWSHDNGGTSSTWQRRLSRDIATTPTRPLAPLRFENLFPYSPFPHPLPPSRRIPSSIRAIPAYSALSHFRPRPLRHCPLP